MPKRCYSFIGEIRKIETPRLQPMMGIILVHAQSSWFVVGLGRNEMEYSILPIVSFLAIAYTNFGKVNSTPQ